MLVTNKAPDFKATSVMPDNSFKDISLSDYKDEKVVLGMDILAPEGYGEIVGGSERETSIDILLERIEAEGLNKKDYEWFLDLRKYGSVPHSGFGMGLERVVAWICGISHIRETIPFARTMNRLNP